MRHYIILLAGCSCTLATAAQPVASYHPAARRVNDLVHTRLAVRFDYAKRYLYGQEWLTLRPHATATDTLRLDAKVMNTSAVALLRGSVSQPLTYTYNQRQLLVHLGRPVSAGETTRFTSPPRSSPTS